MAKQLNVNLAFNADTTQAKAQIQQLQTQLKSLSNTAATSTKGLGLDKELSDAISKVGQLRIALEGATTSTGGLDLGKFNQSLVKSKTSITDYADALATLGPQGKQAFATLAQSITTAEVPLKRASGVLSEFATTLKNTVRWQISSSILHGFMGSIQGAYHYAQNLNESLNSIRIVTGQTTEQMAAFAEKANKAAQSLSTTTTAYTDAALIFYQQGLDDDAVIERTNAVIKMANVTKDSETEVSSYMTAIWNNFAGEKERLEDYADVITALGAATASSSAEIAGGLEKFAAIGQQIGLSYDYATTALATVVAKTRQSEDVVGTAFKTIFARIQGLNLGETLDDGTDLNKYSKALAAVGISIKDASGELKDMDTILDEMGSRWQTLAKDEQVALAQTVAGVRQYNQLIALMDSWQTDFQKNLGVAKNSSGELQRQADIYAESWEAARDRVKASAQAIYKDLLDDDAFISITNGFAKLLNLIEHTIDGLGGLSGVLPMIASLMFRAFGKDMVASLERMAYNIQITSDKGRQAIRDLRTETNQAMSDMFNDESISGSAMATVFKETAQLQEQILAKTDQLTAKNTELTAEEQRQVQQILEINKSLGDQYINVAKLREEEERHTKALEGQARQRIAASANKGGSYSGADFKKQIADVKEMQKQYSLVFAALQKIQTATKHVDKSNFKNIKNDVQQFLKAAEDAGVTIDVKLRSALERVAKAKSFKTIQNDVQVLENVVEQFGVEAYNAFEKIREEAQASGANMKQLNPILDQLQASMSRTGELTEEQITLLKSFGIEVDNAGKIIGKMNGPTNGAAQGFVALGNVMSTTAMAFSSFKGLIDTWNNEDMSAGDRLLATFTTLGMVVPMVTTLFRKQTIEQMAGLSASILQALGLGSLASAQTLTAVATEGLTAATAGFGATLYTVLWPIGLVMLAITALVAVVAGLVALFKDAQAKSPEGQLKKAQAAADDLAESLGDAKEEAANLRSAFSSYDSVVEKLNSCVKGTDEWKQALQDVNNEVLSILEKYPELLEMEGAITRGENNELKISKDAMDKMIDIADKQVQTLQTASLMMQQEVREKKLEVAKQDLDVNSMYAGGTKNIHGEQVTQYVNAKSTVTKNAEELSGLTNTEMRARLEELLKPQADAADMTATQFNNMIDDIMGCADGIRELGNMAKTTAGALDQTSDAIVRNNLGDEYGEAEVQMTSEALKKAYDDSYERWKAIGAHNGTETYTMADGTKKSFEGVSASSEYKSNESVQALWDAYNNAMGTNYKMDKKNGVLGTDGNREFQYLDNGKTKKVTLEEVASTIAAAEALQSLGQSAQDAQKSLADMDAAVNNVEVSNGIREFITGGSFSNMDSNALEDLQSQIDTTNINGVTGTEAYLDKLFGDGKDGKINDDTAKKYGYESAADMVAAFEQGMADAAASLNPEELSKDMGFEANGKTYNTAGEHFKELFDSIDYSEMTSGAMKNFSNAYKQIFEQGGEDALSVVDEIVKNAGDKSDEVAALIADTDWTNWDSIESLKQQCADLGYTVDDSLITELEAATGAVKNFDTTAFCEQLANVVKIIDGLNTGDTISADDYAKLGEGYEDYFMLMADGTYKLIGQAEAFHDAVMSKTVDDLRDKMAEANANIAETQAKIDAANGALDGKDLDALSTSQYHAYTDDEDHGGYTGYYNSSDVKAQVDFLEKMGYNADKIQAWRDDLANGDTTADVLQKIGEEVDNAAAAYENFNVQLAEANASLEAAQEAYASTAQNFSELEQMFKDGEISAEAYSKAWTALDNEQDLDGLNVDEVNAYAESLQEVYKEQGLTEKGAQKMAQAIMRMNRGIDDLADNFADYKDIITKSDEASQEFAVAMNALKEDVSDLTGVSTDYISKDFVKDHLEDIEKAATGDADAIDRLKAALGESIIASIIVENGLDDEQTAAIWDSWNSLQEQLSDIQVGVTLDGESDFVNSLNAMIEAAGMTQGQVNELLSSMGFETNFATETEPTQQVYPVTRTITEVSGYTSGTTIGPDGEPIDWQYPILDTQTQEVNREVKEGEVTAFAMTTDGSSPKIDSVTRTNTGASNNYSSQNSRGKKPGKSGGNKGGGGSDKPKEPQKLDHKKNEEVEEDRYHVITEQLERLNNELEKISKAKDRAFGPKKLALMDAEIAKQKELIAKNKEYATALKNNRNAEMEQLKALGAVFDGKGVITNYNKLIKANQADYSKYNEKIDYYNGLSAEKQEALDKAYQSQTDADGNYYSGYQDFIEKTLGKTAEKSQEEFEKLLKNYESDQEEYEKIMQEIQDAKDAIFDEKLEKIGYVVDIKLDVDDSDIKYLEFLLTELEDKDFHAAEAIANIGLQTGKSLDKIKQYEKGIEDILKLSGYEGGIEGLKSGDISLEELQKGGLTEEGLAKLEEYVDGLADANEQLREMRENAWAQVNDEFEEYLEKMDRGLEKIEHLKSITQSYQNIVDIVGKKFLGVSNDLIDKMNKSVVSQSQDLLKANKAKMEALQASYDQLKNEDTSGWSDQALKERQQLLDKMEDELQSAKEAFMSSWEEALQASADRYAQAVDNIIEEFSDKIAGLYGSLDELQEAYDRASDIDSQYLEDYEQIYQLSKLTRDINNSIDDTDNIAAKEEYRDLLKEINQIEEDGTKLSEYDLEVLQKKFELKQAQIALEEAQNAKSSVGMVRGEDGNYSYVYTANDDDVANAEQNYEDKLHEMQVLNGEYINNLQEQIIQTQAECAEALATIKESDFNSYEEWREAVDRTQAYYDQKMDFYYSQLDGALTNNRELYENDWQKYHDLTGYKISDDENYVDKFEETNYSILTGYQTLEEAHGAWTAATGEMLLELSSAYSEWQTEVENAMALAGTSVDEFADKMEEDTERNVQDSGKAAESVVNMGQQMEDTFSDTLSAIADWESEWGSAIDNAIANNEKLIKSFNEMKREMANAMDAVSDYNPGGDSGGDSNSDGSKPGGKSSSDDSGPGGANNADKVEGVAAAIWMDGGTKSGWYVGNDRKSRLKEKGITEAQAYINAHGPNGDIYATWNKKRDQLKKFYYGSFDTGGYTGDWGDKSGRLALLHSKEIVLNAKDTENFLQAIDMVREISSRIDLNAKYTAGIMDMMQPSIGRGGTPEIVQNIEINADFPDATDHSEIELAFNNLINTASQYANRVR